MIVNGDVFARDSKDNKDSVRKDMASTRGVFGGPVDDIKQLLTPSGRKRYTDYAAMLSSVEGGSFIFDITQDPLKRPRLGAFLPTCTRRSQFISLTAPGEYKQHVFTADEIASSQGWPTLDVPTNAAFRAVMNPELEKLTRSSRSSVLGNGMHLVTLTAWNLYVASHCVRRDSLQLLAPPLFCALSEQEDLCDDP